MSQQQARFGAIGFNPSGILSNLQNSNRSAQMGNSLITQAQNNDKQAMDSILASQQQDRQDQLLALQNRKQDFAEGANTRALQLLKDQDAYKKQQGALLGKDLSNATRDTILAASMNPERLRKFQQGEQWSNTHAAITEQDRLNYTQTQSSNPNTEFSLQEFANSRKNGEFINNVIQGNIANPRNTVDPDTLKANVRQAALANGLSPEEANKQAELAYKDTFNIMDKDLVKSMMPTGTAKLKGSTSTSSSSNNSKGRGLAEFSKGIEIEKSLDETLDAYDKDVWQTWAGFDKNLGDVATKNLYKSEINKLTGALSARNLKSPYVKKALINIVEGGTLPTVTDSKGKTRQLRMEELANDEGFIASVASLQNSFEGGAGSNASVANYNASVLAQQQANFNRTDSLARSTYYNGATSKQQDKQFQDAADSFYGGKILPPNKPNKIVKTESSTPSALDIAKQNNPNHVDKPTDKKVKKATADETTEALAAANNRLQDTYSTNFNNTQILNKKFESRFKGAKELGTGNPRDKALTPEELKVATKEELQKEYDRVASVTLREKQTANNKVFQNRINNVNESKRRIGDLISNDVKAERSRQKKYKEVKNKRNTEILRSKLLGIPYVTEYAKKRVLESKKAKAERRKILMGNMQKRIDKGILTQRENLVLNYSGTSGSRQKFEDNLTEDQKVAYEYARDPNTPKAEAIRVLKALSKGKEPFSQY